LLLSAPWTAFLGPGPNEATAGFGAAKLIEAAQQLGVATNLEEWAHECFVTSAGDPVVLINPSGAGHDRGLEIPVRAGVHRGAADRDQRQPAGAGRLTRLAVAAGDRERSPEGSPPVTACRRLPSSASTSHGQRESGLTTSRALRREHYDTIHRVTIGEPA
jgi:hypothetical protein